MSGDEYAKIQDAIADAAKKQILSVLPKVNTFLKAFCDAKRELTAKDVEDNVIGPYIEVSSDEAWANYVGANFKGVSKSEYKKLLGLYVPSSQHVHFPKFNFKKCQSTVVAGHEFLHLLLTDVANVHPDYQHILIQGAVSKGLLGWAPPEAKGRNEDGGDMDGSAWSWSEGEMCTDDPSTSLAGGGATPPPKKKEPIVTDDDMALNEMPGDRGPASAPPPPPGSKPKISDAEADRLSKEADKMFGDMQAQQKALLAAPPAVDPNKDQPKPPPPDFDESLGF
ncbi:MAG: hypothetical protein HY075_09395 [Deltaproteobacteria bacterium]|nr:hypothetical protein [Deltaproteobacteria bacterium]